MCFSASASFLAGTALTSTGIVTLKKSKNKSQLPLALIPLLFGLQQLIEGFVWLSLSQSLPRLNIIATYSFVLFANVLWPTFVPIAVGLVEAIDWRKKAIATTGLLGIAISVYSLTIIILDPIQSQISCNSIRYIFQPTHFPFLLSIGLYVIATCLSCVLSSHRLIRLFGLLGLLFLLITGFFYSATLTSVWCFFAAILSLIIYQFFKHN